MLMILAIYLVGFVFMIGAYTGSNEGKGTVQELLLFSFMWPFVLTAILGYVAGLFLTKIVERLQ